MYTHSYTGHLVFREEGNPEPSWRKQVIIINSRFNLLNFKKSMQVLNCCQEIHMHLLDWGCFLWGNSHLVRRLRDWLISCYEIRQTTLSIKPTDHHLDYFRPNICWKICFILQLYLRQGVFRAWLSGRNAQSDTHFQIAIITCMDARLNLFKMFGPELAESHVIRVVGDRPPDALRSLVASEQVLETEFMLVHHPGCGQRLLSDITMNASD